MCFRNHLIDHIIALSQLNRWFFLFLRSNFSANKYDFENRSFSIFLPLRINVDIQPNISHYLFANRLAKTKPRSRISNSLNGLGLHREHPNWFSSNTKQETKLAVSENSKTRNDVYVYGWTRKKRNKTACLFCRFSYQFFIFFCFISASL